MKVVITEATLTYPNGILDQSSTRNSPTLTTILQSCPTSAGSREAISHTCDPRRPYQCPRTTRDAPKTMEFFFVSLTVNRQLLIFKMNVS